jgi:hypothetical protein
MGARDRRFPLLGFDAGETSSRSFFLGCVPGARGSGSAVFFLRPRSSSRSGGDVSLLEISSGLLGCSVLHSPQLCCMSGRVLSGEAPLRRESYRFLGVSALQRRFHLIPFSFNARDGHFLSVTLRLLAIARSARSEPVVLSTLTRLRCRFPIELGTTKGCSCKVIFLLATRSGCLFQRQLGTSRIFVCVGALSGRERGVRLGLQLLAGDPESFLVLARSEPADFQVGALELDLSAGKPGGPVCFLSDRPHAKGGLLGYHGKAFGHIRKLTVCVDAPRRRLRRAGLGPRRGLCSFPPAFLGVGELLLGRRARVGLLRSTQIFVCPDA